MAHKRFFGPVRSTCIAIIEEVEEGRPLDEAIDSHFSSATAFVLSHKPLIYEIVAGVVRWKLYLDWVLSHFVRKGDQEGCALSSLDDPLPALFHAQGGLSRGRRGGGAREETKGRSTASFVNAVLRRSLRKETTSKLLDPFVASLPIEHSFPLWLVKRWLERFGVEDDRAARPPQQESRSASG